MLELSSPSTSDWRISVVKVEEPEYIQSDGVLNSVGNRDQTIDLQGAVSAYFRNFPHCQIPAQREP